MLRRRFLAGLAAPGAACLAGCGGKPPRPEAFRLRVSSLPRISMGGLYLAHEQGYFSEAGLEVEIHQLALSLHAPPLLAGGQFDISCLGPSPALLNAVAKGAAVKMVACRGVLAPRCNSRATIYGRRQVFPRGLKNLSVLKGRLVAFNGRVSNSEFYLDAILATAGMSSDDVRLVKVPEPDALAALASGKVDAIVASDLDQAPDTLLPDIVRGIGVADALPGFQYAYIAFGPSLLRAGREIGVKFLTAYLRGARDYVDGKTPRFLEELAQAGGLDAKWAREICRREFATDGSIDRKSIEIYMDWSLRKGYCTQPLEVSQFIDTSYIEQARKRIKQRT